MILTGLGGRLGSTPGLFVAIGFCKYLGVKIMDKELIIWISFTSLVKLKVVELIGWVDGS